MSVDDLRRISERIPKVRHMGLPKRPSILGAPIAQWCMTVTCEICGQQHTFTQTWADTAPMQCPYCGRYVYGKMPVYEKYGKPPKGFIHENCWNSQYSCCKSCAIFMEEAIGKVKCQHCGANYNRIETGGRCPYCQGVFQSLKRE